MATEKTKHSTNNLFVDAINRFNLNNESLKQFYNSLYPVAEQIDKETKKGFVEKIESLNNLIEEEMKSNKAKKIKLKKILPFVLEIQKLRPTINTQILYRNIVITLCSNLEILVSDLAKIFYLNGKSGLFDENAIRFSEIKNLQTIEDVKNQIIDKRLFELTNSSFSDWTNFFKKDVALDIDNLLNYYYTPIKETFERRHIFIHNGGLINKKYLNSIDSTYLKTLSSKFEFGKPIETNATYINNSFRHMENFGQLLTHCLWYKICKSTEIQKDERENSLVAYIYEKLKKEEYATIEEFGNFVLKNFKLLNEYLLFCIKVNYWQSLKWQGKFNAEIKTEISNIELSDKNSKIKIAVYALLDKPKDFFETARLALKSKDIDKHSLQEWPLFKEMRKDQRFESLIHGRHKRIKGESPTIELCKK